MTGSVRAHIFFFDGTKKKAQLIMIKYEDWRGFIYDEIYKFQKDYTYSRPYSFFFFFKSESILKSENLWGFNT